MPALSCSAMTCVYNQNELCSKGDIRVGGSEAKSSMETCCESFKERGEGTMFNSTGCGCTKIGVDCKAQNCTFNDNCKCEAGLVNFFVDPYGEIYPCNGLEDKFWKESMGNLRQSGSFYEIWHSEQAEKIRQKVRNCPKHCWMVGTVSPVMKIIRIVECCCCKFHPQ